MPRFARLLDRARGEQAFKKTDHCQVRGEGFDRVKWGWDLMFHIQFSRFQKSSKWPNAYCFLLKLAQMD